MNDLTTNPAFVDNLVRLAQRVAETEPGFGSLHGAYDVDAMRPLLKDSAGRTIEAFDFNEESDTGNSVSLRSRSRALAAVLCEETVDTVAVRLHSLLHNENLTVADAKWILIGDRRELSFGTIQEIGRRIRKGESAKAIAKSLGIDDRSVRRIDNATGIRQARKDRLIGLALNALRDQDSSVRAFARRNEITHYEARTIMAQAQDILVELGEVTAPMQDGGE